MSVSRCSLVVMALLSSASSTTARADGLLRKLPADGSWVAYHSVLVIGSRESAGTIRIQSVGRVEENGAPARWIEVVFEPSDDNDVSNTAKLLIPEKKLRVGVDPVDHVIRAWRREGDGKPNAATAAMIDLSLVGAVLHGPLKSSKTLPETRKFAYQRGNLEAKGFVGEREFDRETLRGGLRSRTWPHDRVPFGVAGLEIELLDTQGRTSATLKLSVNDFGTGAKSVLPDSK